jgi:TnpA family transposase
MSIINIIDPATKETFDHPPVFTAEDRKRFFSVPKWMELELATLKTPTGHVGLVLQQGYFKATKRFYPKQLYYQSDIDFVSRRLGIDELYTPAGYSKAAIHRHRAFIMENAGFQPFTRSSAAALSNEAELMLAKQASLKDILFRLVDYLEQSRIEVPGYNQLAQIITQAFRKYEKQLALQIGKSLRVDDRQLLDDLLEEDETYQTPDRQELKIKRYNLTRLKRTNHSTKPAQIKENIEYFLVIKEKFLKLQHASESLHLSPDVIQHYSTIAQKAQIFQIARRDEKRYLYLLAFIIHQYYTMQDLFIDILLQSVQRAINHAASEQKTVLFETRKARSGSVTNLVDIVTRARGVLGKQDLSPEQKLQQLQALFFNTDSQKNNDEDIGEMLHLLQKDAVSAQKDEDYYDALEKQSLRLQNRVSEIIKQLEFNETTSNAAIIGGINHFKLRGGNVAETAPVDFLKPEEQDVVYGETGKLRVSLYKMLLFISIFSRIKSGELNLTHSYKYRSFDEYLIPGDVWERDKAVLLERAGMAQFQDFQAVKQELAGILHKQYQTTNQHILEGKNEYYKQGSKSFSVATPKLNEEEGASGISELFPKSSFVSLVEVLASIQTVTGYLGALDHTQTTHIGKRPAAKTFYAGIMGLGCNIGVKRIAKISIAINQNSLENTVNWYFAPDNLDKANDRILSFIDRLDMHTLFKKNQEQSHTSSDGQKYPVSGDSLNANYSFKYLGKDRGVTVYCFIDESHRLFYSTVVSSSERDAAYVIDGLMYNEVVKSDIHSTDTHGYSETIFAATHLLGISFAPRIKNFQKQTLYGFEKRKTYEDMKFPLLPDKQINSEAIEEQWDQILRFAVTIKLKETTASQFFRRLSSYSKQHPLYRALKAFGQITKSIFLLRYIDDVTLRQSIEKQLNKLESANKFLKAVFYGDNQEFSQETKEEQLVAEGCKRLIANSIVCWNYLYLSELVANTPEDKRPEPLKQIGKSSIICWQHVNLLGEFDLSEQKLQGATQFQLPKILGLKVT